MHGHVGFISRQTLSPAKPCMLLFRQKSPALFGMPGLRLRSFELAFLVDYAGQAPFQSLQRFGRLLFATDQQGS